VIVDPRPPKRIKADQNQWLRLRNRKVPAECRLCGKTDGLTIHHIVSKSLGGDDVLDNLVWLDGSGTTGCHGLVEAHDPWACLLLGLRLTDSERAYVVGKKGAYYLEDRYGLKEVA
jgi:hypothetical protein